MHNYYHTVKTYFSSYNPDKLYDTKNTFCVSNIVDHICKTIDFSSYTQVLELGCGDGAVSSEIAKKFPSCSFTFLDNSEESIFFARNNYITENCKYICVDALDACKVLEKGAYDIIFSFAFAQYVLPSDFIALNIELLSLLSKNGLIVHFSIPDKRKKIATIIAQNSLNNNFIICLLKSICTILVSTSLCKYEADGHSLWHSPWKIIKCLQNKFIISAVTPSDLWYRFDLHLSKRSISNP